ncbi:MAG: hypothetical protein ABIJ43_04910 [Candidatus Beckwithbacteria bacterium]
MRSNISIITNLYHHLKSRAGLAILFILLVLIIIFLIISPNQKDIKTTTFPSPTSSTAHPSDTTFKSPEPFHISSLDLSESNLLYAISRQNSHLIKITPEETITIYSQPIKAFSHKDSQLAIIKESNKNILIIYNLNTNQSQSFNFSHISPLIDVSFDPQNKGLYLLVNLDVINRTTDLFYISLDNPVPQKLITTKATSLKALTDQNVLLFSYADGKDLSTVSIFNLPTQQESFSTKANNYFISPSKNSICIISSKKVTLINLSDQAPITYILENVLGAYWLSDSKLILIRNTTEGVTQATITPLTTTPTFTLIPSLKDKTLRSIIGYLDNQLYAIDYFNQLTKISL